MSQPVPLKDGAGAEDSVAPTPVNTPLNAAPISQGLSRPTVPDIQEEGEGEGLANVGGVLSGLVQSKLSTLIGKSSGYVENLPVDVKRTVQALKGIQIQQVRLQNEYKRECLELEKKYLSLSQPLYARRLNLILGKESPKSEEIAAGEKESLRDDEEYQALPALPAGEQPKAAGIDDFWLTALQNHLGLSEVITERDQGALKYLRDITISYLPTPPLPNELGLSEEEGALKTDEKTGPGFTLEFHFAENPYFENKVLSKTYVYQNELGYSSDFIYEKAVGTTVDWKEATGEFAKDGNTTMDLTKEWEIKKQRNKNTNRTRLVRKSKPTESFFNFFSPPQGPEDDISLSSTDLGELEEKLEVDYQFGEEVKEKIIPRAVDYFTGKALEYDADEMSLSDDYSDEEDEDSEGGSDDDDETSSSSGSDVPRRKKKVAKVKGGKGAGQGQVNPEECKQQ